jgi:opacity protein-like surface antigen
MRRISGIALATAIAGSAMAAEPVVTPPPVPTYDWTGLYLGINGGGAWGEQDPFNILTNRFDHDSIGFSGGTVGGTAGVQLQLGQPSWGSRPISIGRASTARQFARRQFSAFQRLSRSMHQPA